MTIVGATLTNGAGESLSLSGYYLLGALEGIGMAPQAHNAQQGPYQHGMTRVSGRLRPRVVDLVIRSHANTENEMWATFDDLIAMFQDIDTACVLTLTRSDGTQRKLDVFLDSGLTMPLEAQRGAGMRVDALQLLAPDPTFYAASESSVNWSSLVSSGGWYFENNYGLAFSAWIGGGLGGRTYNLTYSGTWKCYPVITMIGPMGNMKLRNDSTDEELNFEGHDLLAGEVLVVDCRYGYKTVTHSIDGNVPSWLTAASDLATFHLAPSPEVTGGVNTLSFLCTGDNAQSNLIVTYTARYLSA
jgi:hypothetical protein